MKFQGTTYAKDNDLKQLERLPVIRASVSNGTINDIRDCDPCRKTKKSESKDFHESDYLTGKRLKLANSGQDYIHNGTDNFLPNRIIENIKRSRTAKASFRVVSSIVDGALLLCDADGNELERDALSELKTRHTSVVNFDKLKHELACQITMFGNMPMTFGYASNGFEFGVNEIKARRYEKFRIGYNDSIDGEPIKNVHYYHRDWGFGMQYANVARKSRFSKSWLTWNTEKRKAADTPIWIPTHNENLDLSDPVNRLQSYHVMQDDCLNEHYAHSYWMTGDNLKDTEIQFYLSCVSHGMLKKGFHHSMICYVYCDVIEKPGSDETNGEDVFRAKVDGILETYKGSANTAEILFIPVYSMLGEKADKPFHIESLNLKYETTQYEYEEKRAQKNIMESWGITIPELIGVQGDNNSFSDSGSKYEFAVCAMIEFTAKPIIETVEKALNLAMSKLGEDNILKVSPNVNAFLRITNQIAPYMSIDAMYEYLAKFGVKRPDEDIIENEIKPRVAAMQTTRSNGRDDNNDT